jgi:hypothetical protein
MHTALLLDGNPTPISIRVNEQSRFIASPRGGVVKNFELMRRLSDDDVLIYRATGIALSDEEFESLAHKEADPYRRPEAYRNINRETLLSH